MKLFKYSFLIIALLFVFISLNAQEVQHEMSYPAKEGKALFKGEKRFENRGPSCLSCHSISNADMPMGGTFAKDLTDVYSRMGEGLPVWLSAPSFLPMKAAYQNHKLTEKERKDLTAFLKYSNDVGVVESSANALYLWLGGIFGLFLLLGSFEFIWGKRKSKMVKQDIFDRSIKAFDAKF